MMFYYRVWLIINQDLLTNPSKNQIYYWCPHQDREGNPLSALRPFECGVEGRS